MPETPAALPTITPADLVAFIAAAYRAVGIPAADAHQAAALMAASDVSGADGHGVFRLPQYVRRIKSGGLNTAPDIRVIRRGKATALVDGDNGLGSVEIWDSPQPDIVIQAWDGPICAN
jgi:L-2-hydroxycarboxylate dehydrogenase (NAD+)